MVVIYSSPLYNENMKKERVDGYLHARISYFAAIPLLIIGTGIGTALGYWEVGLFLAIGCIIGAYWSPDYDQEMLVWGKWKIIKMLPPVSWVFGIPWVMYWMPYSLLMKHRGISHTPVIGTLTRLLYVSPVIYIIWLLLNTLPDSSKWIPYLGVPSLATVVGLAISDILHWVRDKYGLEL